MIRFCKNCGLLVPLNDQYCPQCGAAAPKPVPHFEDELQPKRSRDENAGSVLYECDQPDEEETVAAMDQSDTTVAMLLFAIPIVGLVLALVWSFGGTSNAARKRLARAYVIRTLVVALLVIVFIAVVALVFSMALHNQLAYSYYYYR